MPKINIIFIIIFILTFSGCQSYSRQIADSERIINDLEQSAAARGIEYTALKGLFKAERERNTELQNLADNFTEQGQRRLESERELVNNIEGISKSRQDSLSKLIAITEEIRKWILSLKEVE